MGGSICGLMRSRDLAQRNFRGASRYVGSVLVGGEWGGGGTWCGVFVVGRVVLATDAKACLFFCFFFVFFL